MEMDDRFMEKVLNFFRYADRTYQKFSQGWLGCISALCVCTPFSIVRRACQIRYGAITEEGEQLVLPNPLTDHNNSGNNSNLQWDKTKEDSNNNPDLDRDALEEILRRLPIPLLTRAKSVCKVCNATISSTHFNVTSQTEHFVTQQSDHGIAFFCAALNQWFPMPLPWNEKIWESNKRYGPHVTAMRYRSTLYQLYLCAAADGLFFFHDFDGKPVIFNLFTKQHRFLPPAKEPLTRNAVELIVRADHFEIIINLYRKLQIYDSRTDEWTDITYTFQYIYLHCWKSTLHNGMAYFTTDFGHHLLCYDFVHRELQFREIEGGLPPQIDYHDHQNNEDSSLPFLVSCNEKLVLVSRLEKRSGEFRKIWGAFPFIKHTLVGIWELDSRAANSEKWSLISVTPPDLLEETVKSSHGTDFMVAASSHIIWLTIKGSMNLLTFNLRSMEWSVLPGCTSAEDQADCTPRRAICTTFRISPSLNLSTNPSKPLE